MYTPVNSGKLQFYYIKVGFNGVKIIQACFRDAENWKQQSHVLFGPYYFVSAMKAISMTQNINLTIKCEGCNKQYKLSWKSLENQYVAL